MFTAIVFLALGLGSMWIGVRNLRPQPLEIEEFLTGEESRPRPAILEAAGPILGLIGAVVGVLFITTGILLTLLVVL